MIYKKKQYSWVNEKLVNGVLYTIYRCDDEPSKTILVSNDKVKKIKKTKTVVKLREEWKKIHG